MLNDIIMSVLLLAWGYWSYELLSTSCSSGQLAISRTANQEMLGIVIGLANAMRQDLFQLAQSGADVPLSYPGKLLSIVNRAREMEARNQAFCKIEEAKALEAEIDHLYAEVLALYAALSGKT